MNIYSKKQTWKLSLFVAAMLIVGASLFYTNYLVKKLSEEERKKVKLWAGAIKEKASLVKYTEDLFSKIENEERKRGEIWAKGIEKLATAFNSDCDLKFLLEIVRDNETVPVILTNDKGEPTSSKNVDSIYSIRPIPGVRDSVFLLMEIDSRFDTVDVIKRHKNLMDSIQNVNDHILVREVELMKKYHEPIEIPLFGNRKNYCYYKDSKIFSALKEALDDLLESFISEIVINSASVPVVYTDSISGGVIAYGNIDSSLAATPGYLEERIEVMKTSQEPIRIELSDNQVNFIYYEESFLLTQLKYYPYIQFGIIGVFLMIAYVLFSTARKAEQNQVWVGMSKETAHQLGTPLSSLMAWMEVLKSQASDKTTLNEMEKDVSRLQTITDRFSKIGSSPDLLSHNLVEVVNSSISYLQKRTSTKVDYTLEGGMDEIRAKINIPLFEWVLENLCKNAVDAMSGEGKITFYLKREENEVFLDITDTGKGIPKSQQKSIFKPGFTSKKRGWGLGLTLVKRIIEDYHKGKIFVKESDARGTTFRIILQA